MAKISKAIIFFSIFVFSPLLVHAATLSISPSTGVFEKGDRVTLKVIVNSNNAPFNAVSGTVLFPASIFSVESVSKANSVLNFWVTEPLITSNSVKFEGIALGGSTGSTGTVITVNLQAVRSGEGQVSFKSGQILANDGQGTDITGNLNGGSFTVKEAVVKEPPKVEPKSAEPSQPSQSEVKTPVEAPQPLPTLKAPEIMLGVKYGAGAILGTSAYPKAQTLVTFLSPDGVKVFIVGVSEEDGSFNILIPNSLKRGDYTVTAVMIKSDKTNSETSNSITVSVGSIISDVTWEVWLLISMLVLAILYLLLRTYHHFSRSNNNSAYKHKVHEAENVVHKTFDILREDTVEQDSEKLNLKEHKRMSEIGKDINEAERIIDKKIKDLE